MVFWDMVPCRLVEFIDIFEELAALGLRVEECR